VAERLTKNAALPVVFTITIFVSAALLFFVQPLFAKLVLPQIGGAPAVWTTAMLFFQSVLIVGYLYAHLMNRYLSVRAQMIVHAIIWATALLFLPLALPDLSMSVDQSAVVHTLLIFALGVGVPFGFLSANAPLLQAWYARSGRADAGDPYYLYGASNFGSLIALLGFPLAAEPLFGAATISLSWSVGFVVLGGLLAASGLLIRRGSAPVAQTGDAAGDDRIGSGAPTPLLIAMWIVLSFVPSSMMLAVTTKISTDIGAVPLLWVIPLSLYLLTFMLTFRRKALVSSSVTEVVGLFSLLVLAALFSAIAAGHLSPLRAGVMVVAFFLVAVSFHARLYTLRPAARHLTLFYVIMSIGGALGGVFNSILAPVVFDGLYEGLMTTALGLILVFANRLRATAADQLRAVLAATLAVVALSLVISQISGTSLVRLALLFSGGAAIVGVVLYRTPRLALFVAPIAVVVATQQLVDQPLFRDRSFFGTHVVVERDGFRLYANGTTVHGAQRISDFGTSSIKPLFYYHENGPLAQLLQSSIGAEAKSVGVVGLGIGALACFAREGQSWEFYEIDSVVDRVARDPKLFSYMQNCGQQMPTHIGDARITIAAEKRQFDILIIDAFSSDAVPVHLLTKEAMQLYMDRLAPGGIIAYHISTRYYPLQLAIGRTADELEFAALHQFYAGQQTDDKTDSPSRVVLVANSVEDFRQLADEPRWERLSSDGGRVWTDDYANLLGLLFDN